MSNKGLTCHFLTFVALSVFAICEEKPRIFIAKSDSWEINGGGGSYSNGAAAGSGGTWWARNSGGSWSHLSGGARPQTSDEAGACTRLLASIAIRLEEFPEELQGEISGLSRSISNPGSSFGTAIAGTILVSVVATGNHAYAIALGSLIVFGVIGLVAGLRLPAPPERQPS